ncbi:MAG: hypothetical protein ACJ8AW_01895 [Rhodopila sp.]
MAKRPAAPRKAKPDPTDALLIELAERVLTDYFFDPDTEEEYKAQLSAAKLAGNESLVLNEETFELVEGDCDVRIEALKTWTAFRVSIGYHAVTMTVEGLWSFEHETLEQAKVVSRSGSKQEIEDAVDDLLDELEDPDFDDEEMADLLDALDDDSEAPLIGDDPTEPPPATGADRSRVKSIARKLARAGEPVLGVEDRAWLEQTPQALPVITEGLVAAASAQQGKQRDDKLVAGYMEMLALELEFVRYRQDRGWDWAERMLDDYQQTLIKLGEARTLPQEDWFMMASALTEARVPVSEEVQTALAAAGFTAQELEPTADMQGMLRGFLDELANMLTSPFEVVETLRRSSAMMPAALRGFLATELALSSQPMLRDAVPLMLLDDDSAVRRDAARALEQAARPDTLSADALRRTIAVRNWIPAADRPAVDSMVRKARMAGVEIGSWPAAPADIEYFATMIDGSGAQSVLTVSRSGKKGVFGGVLLRHGTGVVDAWVDIDLSRSKVNRLLKEAQLGGIFTPVDKGYVDAMIQHAIATGIEHNTVPPEPLLQVAEVAGGSEWKDRRLDPKTEADRLFAELKLGERSAEKIWELHTRGLQWMSDDPIISSWFEDGPEVSKTLAKLPRADRPRMIERVMSDILPQERTAWGERFLLMALWAQASTESKYRERAENLAVVAHAVLSDQKLDSIPIMGVIAMQTVRAFLEGGW